MFATFFIYYISRCTILAWVQAITPEVILSRLTLLHLSASCAIFSTPHPQDI